MAAWPWSGCLPPARLRLVLPQDRDNHIKQPQQAGVLSVPTSRSACLFRICAAAQWDSQAFRVFAASPHSPFAAAYAADCRLLTQPLPIAAYRTTYREVQTSPVHATLRPDLCPARCHLDILYGAATLLNRLGLIRGYREGRSSWLIPLPVTGPHRKL